MFGLSPAINTDAQKIKNILSRGVEEVFVREKLEGKLKSGKQLRVKLGFDPTGPDIHIGRAIILRKLRAFQELGHKVIFVVGDFTARIGDPSDKLQKRPMLSNEQVKENLKNYKVQVGKIIDLKKAEFHHNSHWLSKLTFDEIAQLADSFSVQQMSVRRNFKERMDKGEEVSLREFLYPLMQGYDSVQVHADIEIGGFDQLFNLKAGRVIQRQYKQSEQDVLTTMMLEGTDGRKMSTSWGNIIALTDTPDNMFGKVMSVNDKLLGKYFLLCTDVSEEEITAIEKSITEGLNPREAKLRLAKEIVSLYHSKDKATKAQEDFIATFSKAEFPADAPAKEVKKDSQLADAISDIVSSKSEFTRLIAEGAVYDFKTGQKITDRKAIVERDMDLRIGKHRFVRLKVTH